MDAKNLPRNITTIDSFQVVEKTGIWSVIFPIKILEFVEIWLSNQKQLSCKKGAALKKAMVKKAVKSKVAAKKLL